MMNSMEVDYKITEEREVDGIITYQRVRYYEGSTTTEDELNEIGVAVPITRYRRTALIEEVEYLYAN